MSEGAFLWGDPDQGSLRRSRCIKETGESVTRVDSSALMMYHDLCVLGSLILIQIIPKERTLTQTTPGLLGTGEVGLFLKSFQIFSVASAVTPIIIVIDIIVSLISIREQSTS